MEKDQKQRELTREEMKLIINRIIEDDKRRRVREYNRAKKEMKIAEEQLVATFNEDQRALYKEFSKKRKEFYKKAGNVYINDCLTEKQIKKQYGIEDIDEKAVMDFFKE